MKRKNITIIIPVIHSIEDLNRCLESINQLVYPKDLFQVAIVDCGMVPGLTPFLANNLPTQEYRAKVLQVPARPLLGPKWLVEQRSNEACNYAVKMMPAQFYIFTEDDCVFMPDWLEKYEDALADEVGTLGGPDILPDGLGWFPKALDYILSSFLGTAGMKGRHNSNSDRYYPRKQNMAIPAQVIKQVGGFPEESLTGGELYLINKIRAAGFKVGFLSDNPVIHRRVTSYINFFRLNAYKATDNVKSLRKQKTFVSSMHFLVFLSTLVIAILGLLSVFSVYTRVLTIIPVVMYIFTLLICGVISTICTRSISVGLGVLLLMPTHHLSLAIGTFLGSFKRIKSNS